MLTIHDVNPTGCFAFGWHDTIHLDGQGIVELSGINYDRLTRTANGSGKTNLLNTICHLLFGEDPTGASDTDMINSVWNKGAWGYIIYTAPDGRKYRIVMARKWTQEYPDPQFESQPSIIHTQGDRYDGTDLYFDMWDGQCWLDKRQTKMPDTRKAILASLGMSYNQFLTTSYLAQQKGIQFVSGRNKDRMELISEMLDLSIWDKAAWVARNRSTPMAAEILRLRSSIEAHTLLKSSMKALEPDEIVSHESTMRQADIDILECAERIRILQLQLADIDREQQAEYKVATTIRDSRNGLENTLNDLSKAESNLYSQKQARIKEITNRHIDDRAILDECAVLSAEIRTIDKLLSGVMSGAGTCNKCGSQVSDDHIAAHRAEGKTRREVCTGKIQTLMAQKREMELQLKAEQQRNIALIDQEVAQQAHELNVHITQVKTSIADVDKRSWDHMQTVLADIGARRTAVDVDITNLHSKRNAHMSMKESARMVLDINDVLAKERHLTRHQVSIMTAQLQKVEQEFQALHIVAKGMGDKGIKAHKFGSIIDSLNHLVREYIEVLTDGQVQVWFTPWRERANTKKSDDVIAEIQIMVREGPKEDVPLDLYSGAERQQITLAIICAFWRLATQRGGGTNILVLDEIFGMFDAPSASLVVGLLDKLRKSHFGTIIVVTHDDKVRQMLTCDAQWIATKREHITTIQPQPTQGTP